MSTRQVDSDPAEDIRRWPVEGRFETPWGDGVVAVQGGRLAGVELPPVRGGGDGRIAGRAVHPEDASALRRWTLELEGYFRGERLSWCAADIEDELDRLGLTPFARRIIEVLMEIPTGSTVSYGELAALAGHPRAARAVGSVMSSNSIPIVIPCHRVIRSDGTMGRYGNDSSWKQRLLDHERRTAQRAGE